MIPNLDINSMYAGVFYAPYIPKMTLLLEESKIHGARYYTIKPVFGDWTTLEHWAVDTYGPPASIWLDGGECKRWYMNDSRFWFREQEDVTVFMLRWS